jgi:aldehyde dehydrogenase (NAD+)
VADFSQPEGRLFIDGDCCDARSSAICDNIDPSTEDDDAARIANDSIYGLSGGIMSRSEERALARRIRTGTPSVSGGLWFGPDAPFGGHKQSGVGRKMGVEGFAEYLETRTIGLPA